MKAPPASLVAGTADGLFASDAGLADVDGDGVPDLAVGRLPIKTGADFANYLRKVQSYEAGGAWRQTVGVATDNRDQGGTYIDDGNAAATLLSARTVVRADVETLGAAGARAALLQCLSAGSELTLYLGHGSFSQVAEEGLLTAAEAAGLTNNANQAGVVGLFGCLMGSFGSPGGTSIGAVLVNSAGGASAVLSADTLVTHADSRVLASGLLAAIYQNSTARLGDAVLAGQVLPQLATYELLGDPALAIGPLDSPRGGPAATVSRGSYAEWTAWAFAPVWGDLGFDVSPGADFDADRATNYGEYFAGTDPTDPNSRLFISGARLDAAGRVQLTWPSVPGRTYRVEKCVRLGGSFEPVATGLPVTAPWNSWTDAASASGSATFYRVMVE